MQLLHADLEEVETMSQWEKWLANAPGGRACIYHIGYLASIPSRIGFAAMNAYEAGLVELVQKRTGEAMFLYFAVRRHYPKKKRGD